MYDAKLGYDPELLKKLGNSAGAYKTAVGAIQQGVNTAIAGYDNQANLAKKEQATANTGAYNTLLKGTNPYGANAEREAMMGLSNSGFSETNRANLGNGYQKSLSENQGAYTNAINNIRLQKNAVISEGNINKANTFQQYYDRNQQEGENRAIQAAQASGNYGGLKPYGWSQSQINAMNKAAQPKVTYRSSGGSSGGTSKPILTASQAYDAYVKKGITNPQVKTAYEYYYGSSGNSNSGSSGSISSGISGTPGINAEIQKFKNSSSQYGDKDIYRYADELELLGYSENDIAKFIDYFSKG